MKFKGSAILEFVDVNTGEKRIEERDNFIFTDKYIDLFQGTTTLQRVGIVYRGSTTYPIANRYNSYYGSPSTNWLYTGYAPSGTSLKTYFAKTTESPAYWEFYSLFLPPATTSAISCLSLVSTSEGDNFYPSTANSTPLYWSNSAKTAINLNPPCYQSPTEYLNIYYRLIMVEDEGDSINNGWVKEQFLLDLNRSGKRFFNNDNILLYPFRVEENMSMTGKVNFMSSVDTSLASKETAHPSGLNLSLYSARKIYNYPDAVPNQYNQINDKFVNVIARGGKTNINYQLSYIHSDKIVPDIGQKGFNGIGNVFGTSSSSTSSYFDAAYFPVGSGKMFASGQWAATGITYPANYDDFFNKVSFLLHVEPTGDLTDSSSIFNGIIKYGNATVSTSVSKFGGGSLQLDGNHSYLKVDQDSTPINKEKFCAEMFFRIENIPTSNNKTLLFFGTVSLEITTTGSVGLFIGATSTWATGGTVTSNTWHHIALTRSGDTFKVYLNGVQVITTTSNAAFTASELFIGRNTNFTPSYDFVGYIDELRITREYERYTDTFSPPIAEFYDYSDHGTVLQATSNSKKAFPERYACTIRQNGTLATSMTYNFWEVHVSPYVSFNLLPNIYEAINGTPWAGNFDNAYQVVAKTDLYKEPSKVHCAYNLRKWIEDRAFITWDSTGITTYDIYHGKLESYNAFSTPALTVSDVRDVKVDSVGNIWIACASTGLWKLTITEINTTLTQIGAPPGCQSKVYAIDVDNFGNIYAIFWGLGLHYSIDGGTTWVNAIINFTSFSDFDESGTNSKWRFVSKLACNPHRNAGNGDAQLLILQKTIGNDGSTVAGCWYDQISANVTGITNSTLRTDLSFVRDNPTTETVVVSKNMNRWVFHTGANLNLGYNTTNRTTYVSQYDGQTYYRWTGITSLLNYMSFQQNAASTGFYWKSCYQNPTSDGSYYDYGNIASVFYEEKYDPISGTMREFAYTPSITLGGRQGYAFDIAYGELASNKIYAYSGSYAAISPSIFNYTNNSSTYTKAIMIGKNRQISFERTYQYDYQYRAGFYTKEIFSVNDPINRTWSSDLYGWDGGAWVKDHPGARTGHYTSEDLRNGVKVRFENGPVSTTSFIANDKYTFTCFDGYYKDNSSKMWMKDTVYYKPKTVETLFEPSTVTLLNNSGQIGVLNSPNINVDWNIDQLPDTVYEGTPLNINGDFYYPYVEYLNYFEDVGSFGSKDEKYDAAPSSITGTVTPALDLPIFTNKATVYLNGESGVNYSTQTRYSMGSGEFTVEMWIYPTTYNVSDQKLIDFRSTASEMGVFYINKLGQLAWSNGSTVFGQTGSAVTPDAWNYIILNRRASNAWDIVLNGVQVASWTDTNNFTSTRAMSVGKRFALTTTWAYNNASVPTTKFANPSGSMTAEAIIPSAVSTATHDVYQNKTINTGAYTLSVFAKKGTRRYFMLRTTITGTERRSVFDFDTNTFVTVASGHTVGSQVLTDGWVRLWVTTTETTNNISRTFAYGPSGAADSTIVWVGTGTEEACYIFGAMLQTGSTIGTYTPSGSLENLWSEDSENFGGSWRGFRGNISNLRITKGISRYIGSPVTPTERFQNFGLDYTGARLRFPGNYLQGSVVANKELVGDWVVIFRDIPPNFRMIDNGRPRLVFGITSSPTVNNITDIAYRFMAGSNNNLLFQRWMDVWATGNQGTDKTAVRFRKVSNVIFIDVSANNGITWSQQYSYTEFAPFNYIAMWQERPSSNNNTDALVSPSVEIVSNGSDYVARVGSQTLASGVFHPKFLAVDSYWETDFKITLNGIETTKNRSNYQAEAAPLEGEVYLHQHGGLRFHAADVGKTISGKVMSLHD